MAEVRLMSEILTPEQIACIQEQWPDEVSSCPWDEVLASHEKLRAQLAGVEVAFQDMRTERDMENEWRQELQADLLALAEAINIQGCACGARAESPNTHPHVSGCPTGKALSRPGVQWLIAHKAAP